jgi:hypothetical protein
MLLKFDLYPVRVMHEELQYPIGTSPFYGEIGNAVRAKFFRNSLNVICLKTKMTEQAFPAASVRFLEEFKKASAARVKKKTIAFASGIAELMGDLKSKDTHVESLGGR